MQLIKPQSPAEDAADHQERSRRFQLARVLKVTGQMVEHANAGQWQEVEELEALRRLELEECLALQDQEPSPLVAEALTTLLYLNDQLVQLVGYARDQMAQQHSAHARGISAVRAYSGEQP